MLLLTSLLAVFSAVHTCDDVNTAACQQLDHVLDVCTHPCFSTHCQRYCGKCQLKCYHCLSTNPTDCSVTEECQGMEYACIQERFLTNIFTVGHKRGCVHIQVCHQLYGATCQNGGECRDHRGFCCRTDLCNKVTSSQRIGASNNIQHKDHRRTANNANGITVCHDVDPKSCKMIINTKPDACYTSCFQQQCPRSCGLCVECSSCNRVDLPEHCNTTTICDPGEKCYTLKTRSTEGITRYKLGCLHQKGCETLHESRSTVFGRSDSIDITIGGNCCTGNLCNEVKPPPPSPSTRPYNYYGSGCGKRKIECFQKEDREKR